MTNKTKLSEKNEKKKKNFNDFKSLGIKHEGIEIITIERLLNTALRIFEFFKVYFCCRIQYKPAKN